MTTRGILLMVPALLIAGCTANSEINSVIPASVDPAAVATVQVVTDPSFKIPANAESLGEVQGSSCKLSVEWPEPTEQDAINKLKAYAAQKGANLVTGVTFTKEGMSYITNCWATIMAKGEAYHVPAPPPRRTPSR